MQITPPIRVKVADSLWVGNISAFDVNFLAQNNITVVINVTGKPSTSLMKNCIVSNDLDIADYILPSQELMDTEILKTCNKLDTIMSDMCRWLANKKNILIQCNDGKNKSMLVAGYYLITVCKRDHNEAIQSLETAYFTEQQKIEEKKDYIAWNTDPEVVEATFAKFTAEEWAAIQTKRSERRAVRGLTMATFRKLLRIKGGAKK